MTQKNHMNKLQKFIEFNEPFGSNVGVFYRTGPMATWTVDPVTPSGWCNSWECDSAATGGKVPFGDSPKKKVKVPPFIYVDVYINVYMYHFFAD